jgi:hypothetical protein
MDFEKRIEAAEEAAGAVLTPEVKAQVLTLLGKIDAAITAEDQAAEAAAHRELSDLAEKTGVDILAAIRTLADPETDAENEGSIQK